MSWVLVVVARMSSRFFEQEVNGSEAATQSAAARAAPNRIFFFMAFLLIRIMCRLTGHRVGGDAGSVNGFLSVSADNEIRRACQADDK